MSTDRPQQPRIASLDQFRGYTVLGMFFVNFVGGCAAIPEVFKHHNDNSYCSYADTIMPGFFFAVGFAYRLTLLRRLNTVGPRVAYLHAVRRNLGLILLGIVIYHLDGGAKNWSDLQALGLAGFLTTAFQREVFQTLVHIAVTSLWVMPVIAAGPAVRIGFACFSGILHWCLSDQFYYHWVMTRPGIDGGPLGFLTWTLPLLAGSLAYDAVVGRRPVAAAGRIFAGGVLCMALGYGLACLNLVTPPNNAAADTPAEGPAAGLTSRLVEPPFVPPTRPVNIWTMCQRSGSLSYQTFGAGFSLALYALFVLLSDAGGMRVGIFRTLGSNALAGYIIHDIVANAFKPFLPHDAPLWYVLAMTVGFLAICYLFIRHLEKNNIYLRL